MADIANKNLLLAERILGYIRNEQLTSHPFLGKELIYIDPKFIIEFGEEELFIALTALKRRGAINSEIDDQQILNTEEGLQVHYNKTKLLNFIKTTKDEFLGMRFTQKKFIQQALATLHILTSSKEKYISLKLFHKIGLDIVYWIADYSPIIQIRAEQGVDVDWGENIRTPQYGRVWLQERDIEILDREGLKALSGRMWTKISQPHMKKVDLFLGKNRGINWRCVKCGRLFEKLTDKEQVINHLNNFFISRYKRCHRCSKRNYFSISSTGKIKFLLSQNGGNRNNTPSP